MLRVIGKKLIHEPQNLYPSLDNNLKLSNDDEFLNL